MIIIRAVFSLAVLAFAGVLVVALSGNLWGRYQQQTVALGFSGVYERLASQVGLADEANALWAFVETELAPPLRDTRQVEARPAPATRTVVREAALEE
jgi:hypothetical protein